MFIQNVYDLKDHPPIKLSYQTMYNLKSWKTVGYAIRVCNASQSTPKGR